MGQGALWGSSAPGMQEMLSDISKYAPGQRPDYFFQAGYVLAKVDYAILKKAADDKDLSRAGLFNAFGSIGTVDTGGLLPTLTYGSSPNERVPSRDNIIFAIDPTQPGDVKPLTGDYTGGAADISQF